MIWQHCCLSCRQGDMYMRVKVFSVLINLLIRCIRQDYFLIGTEQLQGKLLKWWMELSFLTLKVWQSRIFLYLIWEKNGEFLVWKNLESATALMHSSKDWVSSLSTKVGFNTDTVKREYFLNKYVSQVGGVNNKGGCEVEGKGIWEVSTFLSILQWT